MQIIKRILPFDYSKKEFLFFVLYTLFIIYGSLFPFEFKLSNIPIEVHNLKSFLLCNYCFKTSIGDIVTNLFLFVPFGFLGVRSMRSPFKPLYYTFIITLISIPIAHGVQLAQFFVKGRVPSLMDSICNIIGCFLAGLFGSISKFRFIFGKRGQELWKSLPLLIMICWILYNLVPFIPTLDFGEIKNSLKPLLLHPQFDFLNTIKYLIGWIIFSYMYKQYTDKDLKLKYLLLIITITLLSKIFIERRVIGIPHVLGALSAILAIKFAEKKSQDPKILFFILLTYLTIDGLWPFNFHMHQYNHFHLIPFYGFLEGNLFITSYVMFQKAFFYASLIWILEQCNVRWSRATIFCVLWAATIEIAQIWFASHTPETTDPLLMFLIALWIKKNRPYDKIKNKTKYLGPDRRKKH